MTKRFFIIITLLFSFISGKALAISLGDLKKTLENATEEIKKEIENNSNQNSEKKKTDTKSDSTEKEVVKEENKNKSDKLNINISYCGYDKESIHIYRNVKSISDKVIEITDYDNQDKPALTMKYALVEKFNNENTKNRDLYVFEHIKNGSNVWIIPETREITFSQWNWSKCPDEEAIELIKNGTFNYSTYEEYLVAKEREKTKSVVYDNYKGTMICTYLQATLEIKSGKITRFTTSRFNMSNEYGEWRVIEEKSDPKKLFIHVKAINNVSNSFNEFTYDFKYYLYKDFFGNTEEQCEKKLEF